MLELSLITLDVNVRDDAVRKQVQNCPTKQLTALRAFGVTTHLYFKILLSSLK